MHSLTSACSVKLLWRMDAGVCSLLEYSKLSLTENSLLVIKNTINVVCIVNCAEGQAHSLHAASLLFSACQDRDQGCDSLGCGHVWRKRPNAALNSSKEALASLDGRASRRGEVLRGCATESVDVRCYGR